MTEHSVIVTFYSFAEKFWNEEHRPLDPLFDLEDEIIERLNGKDVGELDGHEIAVDGSDGFLFLYGPDADALYEVIEPLLRASKVTQGGHATLRYGAYNTPNIREKYIEIKPHLH
ncbi:MAG TPA: hypothetical protein VKA94_10330 [Hyphomicrobiales bacterium]|nr:hypothetical protein [Hyphomicrobiales bacterium]